jgi:hypothetical protein
MTMHHKYPDETKQDIWDRILERCGDDTSCVKEILYEREKEKNKYCNCDDVCPRCGRPKRKKAEKT